MQKKILLILLLPILIITLVYAQEISNLSPQKDCSEAIKIIKENHEKAVRSTAIYTPDKYNWYAAGLMLGLHYIEKDCNTAKEKMNEILDNLWDGQKEFGGQPGYASTDITDKISSSIRFIKSIL